MKKIFQILPILFLVGVSSCNRKIREVNLVSTNIISLNKITAKRYLEEIVNHQRLDLLKEIFTNDIQIVNGKEISQIKIKEEFLPYFFKAFPDIYYTIDEIIAEGDKVVIQATANGTHKEEFLGYQPFGNKFEMKEVFIFKMEKGKIKNAFGLPDRYNLEQQLKAKK